MEYITILEQYFKELPLFVREHSERVGTYAQVLVKQLKSLQKTGYFSDLKLPVQVPVNLLGRYHDIGKTGVDSKLWNSTGLFDNELRSLANTHTIIGAHLVRRKLWLPERETSHSELRDIITDCCLYPHERWDGGGYPFGLKGDRIPFYARLIAIADSYDAMMADRPYHVGISSEEALQEIRREAGKQFDPDLAEAFCMSWQARVKAV